MRKSAILSLATLLGFNLNVQAVNLRGKVLNKQGRALANAVVTLTPQGLADTTGSDGNYAIVSTTSIASTAFSGRHGVSFKGGVLQIILDNPMALSIEVFDTRGTRLRTERIHVAPAGVHRWDIENSVRGIPVFWINATFGEKTVTFRHARVPDGKGGEKSNFERVAPASGGLLKAAADPDSLKVTAPGHVTKTVALTSLDAVLDVTLDSSGNGLKNPPGPSAGCGKTPTLANGSRTIQAAGQNRSYTLRIPANYDRNHPYPLVFAFHWNGGTMGDVDGGGTSGYTWSYYGIREKADLSTGSKMIFIAPQGIGNGWPNTDGRDLAMVDEILKLAKGDLCVDTTRVFSMGFSYGGGMTYAIACARAKVFRAAAVYAGAQLSGCTDGTQPIAYIGFHGLRDQTCRIDGGRTLRDKFVKNNSCPAQTVPEPAANSLKHVCTSYSGCNSAYPVRWCAFDGAGHSPAPIDGSTSDSGGGDRTWTKDEAWSFFTQF